MLTSSGAATFVHVRICSLTLFVAHNEATWMNSITSLTAHRKTIHGKLSKVWECERLSMFVSLDVRITVLCQTEEGWLRPIQFNDSTLKVDLWITLLNDIIVTVRSPRAHRGDVMSLCLLGLGLEWIDDRNRVGVGKNVLMENQFGVSWTDCNNSVTFTKNYLTDLFTEVKYVLHVFFTMETTQSTFGWYELNRFFSYI